MISEHDVVTSNWRRNLTIAIVCSAAGIAISGCGILPSFSAGAFPRVSIPSEIAASSTQKLELIVAATGIQIYRCDAKAGAPGIYEWVFQAPEAVLRDVGGKHVGKHYAGPTWEAEDGSRIVGTVEARRDAPDKSSIPWLRLTTRSTAGSGTFSPVTAILRVSTTGGMPPQGRCSEPDHGRILRVDYTADYYFYVNR